MTTSLSPFYYHTTMGGFIGLNPQIVHWKPDNTPQGVMSGSIRPLTNKDYTNTTIYKIIHNFVNLYKKNFPKL